MAWHVDRSESFLRSQSWRPPRSPEPLPAEAGAPNYECAFSTVRIGIDQHARVGLARRIGDRWRHLKLDGTGQNGESFDVVGVVDSDELQISVRGLGASATLTFGDGTVERGACAVVPGNFVLGLGSEGAIVRAGARASAPVLALLTPSSLIWTSGRYGSPRPSTRPGWTPVSVVQSIEPGERLGMGHEFVPRSLSGWVRTTQVKFVEGQPQGSVRLPPLKR